jgi:hypothetical protein
MNGDAIRRLEVEYSFIAVRCTTLLPEGASSACRPNHQHHIVVVNWFTELRAKMGGGG